MNVYIVWLLIKTQNLTLFYTSWNVFLDKIHSFLGGSCVKNLGF